jgi:hypothetical protein
MTTIIKLVLIILLLLCLADMPYGYYQIVRFISFVGFSILAYSAYKLNIQAGVIIYASLALLFQPFIKLALGRQLWNIIDVIVAIRLIVSIFLMTTVHNSEKEIS